MRERLTIAPGSPVSGQGVKLNAFSPREVQSRVRAGASVDDVVAATGWPEDKVLRYAEPVLGERDYVATRAQAVEVRRSGGGSTLLETTCAVNRLPLDDPELTWDSLRREDGRWVVTASLHGTRAQWTYDQVGHTVHPLDDIARAWMGVAPVSDPIEDALGLVADTPVVRIDAEVETIEPVSHPSTERPRLVAVPAIDESQDHEVVALQTADTFEDIEDFGDVEAVVDFEDFDDLEGVEISETIEQTVIVEIAETVTVQKPRKAKSRRSRASVPSWDEILFGTKPDDSQ